MSSRRTVALPLLSKSLFKLGVECARKIHYRRERYPGSTEEDPYLSFLADGGFMVEALARALFPAGRDVEPRPGETPAQATRRELSAGDVDLFEAVFEAEGMSARADIVSRRGNVLRLIEIKAASYHSEDDAPTPFRGKRGGIDSGWKPYLIDVAFQTMVVRRSLGSGVEVRPELCLVDTARKATGEFTFGAIEIRSEEEVGFGKPRARFLGDPAAVERDGLLGFVDASAEVEELLPEVETAATRLAGIVRGDLEAGPAPIGRRCRDCEYRDPASPEGNRGFLECWGPLGKARVHFLDVYGLHILDGRDGEGVARLVRDGISELVDIPDDLVDGDSKTAERQRIQIECTRTGRPWQGPGLARILGQATYPLHFVDFETSRLAVPYHAGMRPYEQIAFQFSCHTIERPGGDPVHREWINLEDRYPNFEFARELRAAIGDTGTMLVWSDHERNALADIRRQIDEYSVKDRELALWLESMVLEPEEDGVPARILDLHDLCRGHYVHPRMKGRTSIKYVLPAIWEEDAELRRDPWFAEYVREWDGRILSPYEALDAAVADGVEIPAVRDGTGAMRAYQDMLYGRRRGDAAYRDACRRLLLQYCRLDTAAMVIIWKHWMSRAAGDSRGRKKGTDQ